MSRFVNDLPIGPNNVQIGLVTFGSTAHNEFFLNQYNDKQSTLSAIQKANMKFNSFWKSVRDSLLEASRAKIISAVLTNPHAKINQLIIDNVLI
jgi:hypothetical protein